MAPSAAPFLDPGEVVLPVASLLDPGEAGNGVDGGGLVRVCRELRVRGGPEEEGERVNEGR